MKWEYRVMSGNEGFTVLEFLNEVGELGWELTSCDMNKNIFIFKRPKQELSTHEKQALEGYFGGKVG